MNEPQKADELLYRQAVKVLTSTVFLRYENLWPEELAGLATVQYWIKQSAFHAVGLGGRYTADAFPRVLIRRKRRAGFGKVQ